ncbi:MAG: response regulator [Nitrospirae bacterium]|nr:response regulator [Nitrospirota bacterium]
MSQNVHVLLVEDDQAMLASCRQALEAGRYKVESAPSPKEAKSILLRDEFDLVITDLRMPHGGGMALLETVQRNSPETPVILITAYPSVETAVGAFKGGVVDYLTKPFTDEQFLDAVRAALSARRAREHAALLSRMQPSAPPRHRPTDVPRLAIQILEGFLKANPRLRVTGFSDDALELLAEDPSSGNAIELRNWIHRALSKTVGPVITEKNLRESGAVGQPLLDGRGAASPRRAVLQEYERNYLIEMLDQHEGNVTHTAETLGIHRVTLQRLMRKLGITRSSGPHP